MNRRAAALILAVLLLFKPLDVSLAQTTADREALYDAAVLQLETYLENAVDDVAALERLLNVFTELKSYRQSRGFSHYVTVLLKATLGEFDFQYTAETRMLCNDSYQDFRDYLADSLKDSSVRTVEELVRYTEGRRLEAAGDNAGAGAAYAECLNYFDADPRYQALQQLLYVDRYNEAVTLLTNSELSSGDLVRAYHIFRELGDFEASAEYAEVIVEYLGYRPEQTDDRLVPVSGTEAADRTATSVTLKWDASHRAEYYTVTCEPVNGGAAKTRTVNGTQVVFDGLEPQTDYRFTVTAHAGSVTASGTPVTVTTQQELTPVTGTKAVDRTKDTVTLSWNGSQRAEYYTVTCEPVNGGAAKTRTVNGTQVVFDGLKPQTGYRFTVTAHAGSLSASGTPVTVTTLKSVTLRAGNIVTFGRYPQTSSGSDQTPIEWLVLACDEQNGKALLLSRYGLDARPYNTPATDITWAQSTLRRWLNNDFLRKAFNSGEQGAILTTNVDSSRSQCYDEWFTGGGSNIQDKLFLLSYAEANKYLALTREDSMNTRTRVTPTAYAVKRGAYLSSTDRTAEGAASGWWWLRSPGRGQRSAAIVYPVGSLGSVNVGEGYACVRPALWVDLGSGLF